MRYYLTNCFGVIVTLVVVSYYRTQNVKPQLFTGTIHPSYQKSLHPYISRNISIKINQTIDVNCIANTGLKECNFLSPTNLIYILHRNEDKKCYEHKRICLFIKLPNTCVISFRKITTSDDGTWKCYHTITPPKQTESKIHDAVILRKHPTSILFDSFSLIIDKASKSNNPIFPYLYSIFLIIFFIILISMTPLKSNKNKKIVVDNKIEN